MKNISLLFAFLLLILFSADTFGQQDAESEESGESDRIDGKFKFVPIPFVDYNNSSGFTIGAIPMAMVNLFDKDTISPSSTIGLFGMYSENKTWFAMGFGQFYLAEDHWRINVAAGFGSENSQFYESNPINRWFRYNTAAEFAYLGIQRKVAPNLFLGMSYIYTSFANSSEVFSDSGTTYMNGISFDIVYDRRTNVAYPRDGYVIEADITTYPKAFDNQKESSQMTAFWNKYISSRGRKDVIATRLYTGISMGSSNFNQQFIIGDTDIRGYSYGQFRGNTVISVQGEYRWNFAKKMGAVGFVGLATVYGSSNSNDDGRLLPGIGTGFRYVIMEDTHSTVGFDVAVGDGDWGFYFRLSEAF